MFHTLSEPRSDVILGLMQAFRDDPRENKIDLGVGIYKDANGQTPIMQAVKQVEERLLNEQTSKAYVAPTGTERFCDCMLNLVFGNDAPMPRLRAAQSVGGSGALRVLADLLKQARPEAALWLPEPTWPNHRALLGAAGFDIHTYPYYNSSTCSIDREAMFDVLGAVSEGDIVLLHGCCHNPTGAELDAESWQAVSTLCLERSLLPFIDLAYQGFGDGLDADAASVRLLASQQPELVVAASCSKTFGLYRERVGAALLLAENAAAADRALGQLTTVIRSNYSMPPDHGAAVTERILSDPTMRRLWSDELEQMRQRLERLRGELAQALRKRSNSDRFDYIARQKGMFSRLPLSPGRIDHLRSEQGIYIVGDGRINIAGLPASGMDELAEVLAEGLADSLGEVLD